VREVVKDGAEYLVRKAIPEVAVRRQWKHIVTCRRKERSREQEQWNTTGTERAKAMAVGGGEPLEIFMEKKNL
jgi:hypothetical protein